MRNALILHGKPTRERYENPELPKPHEANWLPWIRSELGKRGVATAIPAFPKPYAPDYEKWSELFERYEPDSRSAIVGHSAGAEFALRWLSEHDSARIRQLILVAPWTDTTGKYGDFSNYELDPTIEQRIGSISLFNSLDDSQAIQDSVLRLRKALPKAEYVEFKNHGHFMFGNNMTSKKFPELLARLIR